MSQKDDARQIINDFAARSGGLWKSLDRAKVAAGALARIGNPDAINQGEAKVCVPAALIHAVAQDAPQDYAQAIVDLYEQGRACLGGRAQCMGLKPSSELINYALPATAKIEPADWILMASIRDSENWFRTYSSVTDKGGGNPRELASWLTDAGYTDVRNRTSGRFLSTLGFWANEADDLYAKGYKVILRVNAQMLYYASQDDDSRDGNHVVGLASRITFNEKYHPATQACYYEGRHRECTTLAPTYDWDASTISFKVFTWGQVRDVPEAGTLSMKSFMGNFYGYVAGKY
jgi:hypothetical protein